MRLQITFARLCAAADEGARRLVEEGRSIQEPVQADNSCRLGMNTIFTEGQIEILAIDYVNGTVTGRIAAVYDEVGWINGNFEVRLLTDE